MMDHRPLGDRIAQLVVAAVIVLVSVGATIGLIVGLAFF